MRRFWVAVAVCGLAGFGAAGCNNSRPVLRPPQVEEFTLPPENESRWEQPAPYPEERTPLGPMRRDQGPGPAGAPGPLGMPGGIGGIGPR